MGKIKKWYAVREGRECAVVVETWDECRALVDGWSKARFRSFDTFNDAKKFANGEDFPCITPRKREKRDKRKANLIAKKERKFPCLMRKSYYDKKAGKYYKDRCVMRQGPIMVGENYVPNDIEGVPW